jgi:hypothetical protein
MSVSAGHINLSFIVALLIASESPSRWHRHSHDTLTLLAPSWLGCKPSSSDAAGPGLGIMAAGESYHDDLYKNVFELSDGRGMSQNRGGKWCPGQHMSTA